MPWLPYIFRQPILMLIGSQCTETLIDSLHVFDSHCFRYALSKGLGLGIVVGGGIVKLPQIYKILSSGSVYGISFTGYILETFANLVTLAYSVRSRFPFTTYGEIVFMGSQNYLITLMLLWYKDRHRDAVVVGAALFGVFVAMMTRSLVGMGLLSFLQALTIPIIVSSRIPQIYAIYKNKSTGQLSAFAVFNYLAGTLARVFTTLTEVDDDLVLAGAVLASIVNVVLAAQMIYYWNAGKSDLPVHSAQQRKGDRRGKQDRGKKFSPWSGQRHTNEGIDLKTK